jgi:hypothetical protein
VRLSESDVTTKRVFNLAHGFLQNVARGQLREVRSSASAESVVPRTHDFEGALCDTAAFPDFSGTLK